MSSSKNQSIKNQCKGRFRVNLTQHFDTNGTRTQFEQRTPVHHGQMKTRISAAGSVLLIGHSGTLNGNSPANVAVSKARAESTLAALKSIGAQGPFAIAGVGALDPASNGKTEADQAKNRRVVIVLIP